MMSKTKLTLTTDGAGAATATTKDPVAGEITGIYIDLGTLDNTTTDITVTANDGDGVLPIIALTNVAASQWYFPIITATHFSGSGTPKTDGRVPCVGYVTVTVAQGGASKAGAAYIFVAEA